MSCIDYVVNRENIPHYEFNCVEEMGYALFSPLQYVIMDFARTDHCLWHIALVVAGVFTAIIALIGAAFKELGELANSKGALRKEAVANRAEMQAVRNRLSGIARTLPATEQIKADTLQPFIDHLLENHDAKRWEIAEWLDDRGLAADGDALAAKPEELSADEREHCRTVQAMMTRWHERIDLCYQYAYQGNNLAFLAAVADVSSMTKRKFSILIERYKHQLRGIENGGSVASLLQPIIQTLDEIKTLKIQEDALNADYRKILEQMNP